MNKRFLMVLAVVFLFSGCAEWREPSRTHEIKPGQSAAAPAPAAAAPTREMVREEIKAVLKDNPQLLLDVLDEHKIEVFDIVNAGVQAKREQAENQRLAEELDNPKSPAIDPERPHKGSVDAPIVLVEYSDFLCPFCSRGARTVQEFYHKHPGEVVVYFKHLPLHENSLPPSLYFEAIGMQNQELAWKFYDLAFAHAKEIAEGGEPYVKQLVDQLGGGLDMDKLAKDVQSEKVLNRISKDSEEADTFNIQGTPFFLIGGVSLPGAQPLGEFDKVLDKVKAKRAQ